MDEGRGWVLSAWLTQVLAVAGVNLHLAPSWVKRQL